MDDVSLSDVLKASHERQMAEVHVAKIGRVVKYDKAKMTADIAIEVKRPFQNGDGTLAYEEWPTLPAVPVIFPRCGAYAITFPLAPGDTVLVICIEDAYGEWRTGASNAEPADTGRHTLRNPVAIPGLLQDAKTTANSQIDALVMGRADSSVHKIEITSSNIILGHGASDFVALASKVQDALDALGSKLNTHIHAGVTPGMGATGASNAAASTGHDVKSAEVKSL